MFTNNKTKLINSVGYTGTKKLYSGLLLLLNKGSKTWHRNIHEGIGNNKRAISDTDF